MIRTVELSGTTWNEPPWRFEAGTPAFGEVVGMGVAIDYITEIGLEAIHAHEQAITRYATERLADLDFVTVQGPVDLARKGGVV